MKKSIRQSLFATMILATVLSIGCNRIGINPYVEINGDRQDVTSSIQVKVGDSVELSGGFKSNKHQTKSLIDWSPADWNCSSDQAVTFTQSNKYDPVIATFKEAGEFTVWCKKSPANSQSLLRCRRIKFRVE